MVVFLLLFLVLPFAELALIVAGAQTFGLPVTLGALVAFSLAGAWLMKHEGWAVWRRANDELTAGRVPTKELLDGALVLGGGALLLTPGFITDIVGLLLLLPPVRAVLRPLALRSMTRRVARSVVVFGTPAPGGPTMAGPWFSGAAPGFGRGDVVDTSGSERVAEARVVRVDVNEPEALGPGR